MQILLTGRPGAGKSYTAVELCIAPALDLGRPVWTSIPLNTEEVLSIWPKAQVEQFTTEQIREGGKAFWDRVPGGALVCVDEAEQVWPSGVKTSQVDQPTREWIAMHRHHVGDVGGKPVACDVVVVTQGSNDIGAWLRSKIDKTYMIEKLDAVGLDKRYKCSVYQGFQDTNRPRKRDEIRGYQGTYRDEITRIYRSHTKASDSGPVSVAELRPDKKATVFSSFRFRAGVVGLPLLVVVALGMLGNTKAELFGDEQDQAVKVSAPKSAPTRVQDQADQAERFSHRVGASARAPVPAPVPAIFPSVHWRVSAVLSNQDKRVVMLTSDTGANRLIDEKVCSPGLVDVECVLDGERVTEWTGRGIQSLWSDENSERVLSGL
jgi:zona occludens toxin